jgi:hypothetical protein
MHLASRSVSQDLNIQSLIHGYPITFTRRTPYIHPNMSILFDYVDSEDEYYEGTVMHLNQSICCNGCSDWIGDDEVEEVEEVITDSYTEVVAEVAGRLAAQRLSMAPRSSAKPKMCRESDVYRPLPATKVKRSKFTSVLRVMLLQVLNRQCLQLNEN